MDKDLQSYIKIYNNWIEKDICEKTIQEINNKSWEQHSFYRSTTDERVSLSGEKELDITFELPSTSEYLYQRSWDAIHKYIGDLNFPWWYGWQGFNNLRFNRYKSGRVMAKHCDHIHSLFEGERKGVPILSILGILNDDYEGGEFVMWEDTVIGLKAGDFLLFPSNFMYPHQVKEVTKGERFTMVSWVW